MRLLRRWSYWLVFFLLVVLVAGLADARPDLAHAALESGSLGWAHKLC